MNVEGTRVLILGGTGLVGMAVARELLPHRPEAIVLAGLSRDEAEAAARELRGESGAEGVEVIPEWGDVFLPEALKERRRGDLLGDPEARRLLLDDLYETPVEEAVERSAFGALLARHTPGAVVDCINTATVFAYQDAFSSASELRAGVAAGNLDEAVVERHLATLYLPQLIRHVQVALEALRRAGTLCYVKIGTAGTGGQGLNIPFTHSEERPSRMLLAKSSLAGAHTLLLYLMARTPGAPAVKEIKPTAAISWKRIAYGDVHRGGRPVTRVDAVRPLPLDEAFDPAGSGGEGVAWQQLDEPLRGVYVDAGENGLFSPPEFETLTSLGLMEFITPEEIARDAVREILGRPTGRDVVAALDASTSGPTYRAGVMRESAIARMAELEAEHGVESVAYEMLGPPRLSKLLFEGAILGRVCGGSLRAAADLDPEATAEAADALLREDGDLRTRILSIGLPILLPDGERLLRGAELKGSPRDGTAEERQRLTDAGWVDLRPANWERWRGRVQALLDGRAGAPGADGGSRADLDPRAAGDALRPGALAAWVFRVEDRGERIKR
jgi:NAD(P)-dependent dehydrogenase (short-subunit alcohol dehydrogenase family)